MSVTSSAADALLARPPAVMSTVVETADGVVVTGNVARLCPAGIVMAAGTAANPG